MKPFKFKEFNILQDKTAMKVGTDGVLLGAWVEIENKVNSVLDIGAGTGLIALQIAQRSDAKIIDAIEIENDAFEQTVTNFENSNWADRLYCYHTSLQAFADEIDEKYDLIVSNPPFYTSTYKKLEQKRAMARHANSMPYKSLLLHTSKLLNKNGSCAFIIPFQNENIFLEIAAKNNLYPNRITHVKGNASSVYKRSLLQMSFKKCYPIKEVLIIEITRHIYTQEYKDLVKDFYLNM